MHEDWDKHKNEIQELYLSRGYTLEKVMKFMLVRHSFKAAPRTYKMKFDEWSLRKNKYRKCCQCRPKTLKPKRTKEWCVSTNDKLSIEPTIKTPTASHLPSRTTIRSDQQDLVCNSESPVQIEFSRGPDPTTNIASQIELDPTNFFLGAPSLASDQVSPIVNSSLMFFSTNTDAENLQLLSRSPVMKPWAVEILLRNWKAGGEHMHYISRFLQDPACCQTLLAVNWTRWTDQDETLFDLIESFNDEFEQVPLTKALLRADLIFRPVLPILSAHWAPTWRLAIEQTDWKIAKSYLVPLDVPTQIWYCAVVVVAEALLARNRGLVEKWKGGDVSVKVDHRYEYLEILRDCRDYHIEIDASWYALFWTL